MSNKVSKVRPTLKRNGEPVELIDDERDKEGDHHG